LFTYGNKKAFTIAKVLPANTNWHLPCDVLLLTKFICLCFLANRSQTHKKRELSWHLSE